MVFKITLATRFCNDCSFFSLFLGAYCSGGEDENAIKSMTTTDNEQISTIYNLAFISENIYSLRFYPTISNRTNQSNIISRGWNLKKCVLFNCFLKNCTIKIEYVRCFQNDYSRIGHYRKSENKQTANNEK